MNSVVLRRRHILYWGLSALGVMAWKQCVAADLHPQAISSSDVSTPERHAIQEIFLEARPENLTIGDRPARLFTYNGKMPGPIITTQAGETLRIHLKNQLSEATNLHFHGLHISPMGNADNIMIEIDPGESFTYEFTLPKNHSGGTFWYHPHLHDSTARQVFNGLSGLLIVRGALDEIPEIKAATEHFLVLKDFALGNDGQILPPDHHELMIRGREGPLLTINGEINPTFTIAENGLLRLRFLNASSSRFYRLALENHPFYLIATDGGALAEPIELSELLLVPGERAEVLIKGDRAPQTYRLLNLPYNRGGMGMGGGMRGGMGGMGMGGGMGGMMDNGFNAETREPPVLATFQYQGKVEPIVLPSKLGVIEPLGKAQTRRKLTLNAGMGEFAINGEIFDENRIDFQAKLNTIEEWEIRSSGMAMDHPFHLHTNPFQVISRNGDPEPILAWRDTVLIHPNETVRIRTKFQDFGGQSFYHCHIFDHSDRGMMGRFEIQENT